MKTFIGLHQKTMILKSIRKQTLMQKKIFIIFYISFFIGIGNIYSQEQNKGDILIDEVVALVGDEMIMYSDIEAQYFQMKAQGLPTGKNLKCEIFEDLLFQKLLINQAELDSIVVNESQVESELERRMQYFISQIGSKEKLEEYYDKSVVEIKEELRDVIKDQMVSEKMKNEITKDIKITPSEVRKYFNTLPEDSIPTVEAEMEIKHIVNKPPVTEEEIDFVKAKLKKTRRRILEGESFKTLAALYSEDPGSAKKGGELGFFSRGELYPEYEAVAFGLEKGEISPIVKTKAGYHIIQLIERRGEQINTRHILMKPKVSTMALVKAKKKLDSIGILIKNDTLSFSEAAKKFSDDDSKVKGGDIINPATGNTKFKLSDIDPSMYYVVSKMDVGEISDPVLMETKEGNKAYRILYIKSLTKEHQADIDKDYSFIKELALQKKQQKAIEEWINQKKNNIYIDINENYKKCDFNYKWGYQ